MTLKVTLKATVNLTQGQIDTAAQALTAAAAAAPAPADSAPALALDAIQALGVEGLSRKDLKAVLAQAGFTDDLGGKVLEPMHRGGWGVYLFAAPTATAPAPSAPAPSAPAPSAPAPGAAAPPITVKHSAKDLSRAVQAVTTYWDVHLIGGWGPYVNAGVVENVVATHPCMGYFNPTDEACKTCPLAVGCRLIVKQTLQGLEAQILQNALPDQGKNPREIFEDAAGAKGMTPGTNPSGSVYVPMSIDTMCSYCNKKSQGEGVLVHRRAYCYPCAIKSLDK